METRLSGNWNQVEGVSTDETVNPTDTEIIDACLEGRTEAFGLLVVRHQDRLFNTLVKILGSVDAAQEATQIAFVHAYHRLTTFQRQSAFYSWLFRIAMNGAVSEKRKKKRLTGSIDEIQQRTGAEPVDSSHDNHPSHAMEVEEKQKLVQQALSELQEEYRTVLILKELEGMSYEEIASVCGCPIGTVRSRIHRARQELKEKLKSVLKSI